MKAAVLTVTQDRIVDASIKRFSHFGINKTSLSEIAQDLNISRPSLAYYFNDKDSLMEAVGNRIVKEFLEKMEQALASAVSVEAGLLRYVEYKRDHFKKYYLLAMQANDFDHGKISPSLLEVIHMARRQVETLVSGLLYRGIEQQELHSIDVEKTALLIIETLEAFEHTLKRKNAVPDNTEFESLFEKQKEVVHLLLNGLKYK